MPTPSRRAATLTFLGLRMVYGAALVAAPTRLSLRWLGPAAASAPTQVPLRALGARELVIHAGAFAAALRGAPVRPWLVGSLAGDLTDIAATVAGRADLPAGAPRLTVLAGGTTALAGAALAIAADE